MTLASPHRGTPIATAALGDFRLIVAAVYLVSIFGVRQGPLRNGIANLSSLLVAASHLLPTSAQRFATDPLVALLAGLDSETANEIQDYFDALLEDRGLMFDLTVAATRAREAALHGPDHPRIDCYVTVSPPPSLFGRHPVGRLLYARVYHATATEVLRYPAPTGPVLAGEPLSYLAVDGASDGVVPSVSQTLTGAAAGIVLADHEDVIGHYEGGHGSTVFKSGATFRNEEFRALWTDIAQRLVAG